MYDPVLIASGQTFERMWIQKWLDEGHDTCPKSKIKLAHQSLIPNTALKDLISKWCRDQGVVISDASIKSAPLEPWENSSTSLSSLGSSLNDIRLHLDVSSVSLGSLDTSCSSDSSQFKTMESSGLIPCKVVEDVMNHLQYNDEACQSMSLENLVEPLLKFLRDACHPDLHDLKAQKTAIQLVLAFLCKSRSGIPFLDDSAFSLLASFLDSELMEEALGMMELLSCHCEICPTIFALDCIPKLVPLLGDYCLVAHSVDVLKNSSGIEEARVSIAEASLPMQNYLMMIVKSSRSMRWLSLLYARNGPVLSVGNGRWS
ncbi:U-box domain [Dillenia turbinata]|uniref:RING-type E3 ubiquitin transferase n=1 Tax=Dillenia turbinata TaxID=194707 RepID=A0AAN8UXP4_9MAGN